MDGTVLAYTGSHRFPTADDPPATVDLASIPAWCVPGCTNDTLSDVGEYLRLSADGADVILTETAVLKLYHQLGEWLMTPKRKAVSDA
jgi:hypothetical protein